MDLTLTALRAQLDSKQISATELTQYFLKRVRQYDTQLNSFITVCEETALQQAAIADQRIAKNNITALTGIPIAHKDIFLTKGIKTSCASKMLDNFIPPYDATVVDKLNHAGTITLGKTNMDEFAMGSSNETSFYGACKNPWDVTRTPGGSSGGSAAAVAALLAPAATGTDTGGSIRQPAALCGISGIKPTYGRISRYGMIAFASSLDQAGPMARNAEDLAIMLNHMSGFDAKDSTSLDDTATDFTATLNESLAGLKIGLPKEYFTQDLNPETAERLQEVMHVYKKLGAEFVEISLPHTEYAIGVYYVIAPAECSSNLARFDGVRYGYRCQNPQDLEDLYTRSRSEGFGDEVKRRIIIGTYVLSSGYYDAFYLKAQKVRRLFRDDFHQAFQKVDLILTPTTPEPAFKLGDKAKDPVAMYLNDVYTIAANLAGLPALSVPAGFINDLPIGLQLIGPHFGEGKLLNAAHQFQLQTEWHKLIPSGFEV